MNASLYFIIFSARVISTIRVSIRSLRGKGLRKEIISSELFSRNRIQSDNL